jgi:hypothetical protein
MLPFISTGTKPQKRHARLVQYHHALQTSECATLFISSALSLWIDLAEL